MLFIIFFAVIIQKSFSASSFNYEISARVIDDLKSFLNQARIAAQIPYDLLTNDIISIYNFSTGTADKGRTLFYPLMRLYDKQIVAMQICFPNKLYFSYYRKSYLASVYQSKFFPDQELAIGIVDPLKFDGLGFSYASDSAGRIKQFIYNITYDCKKTPWYKSIDKGSNAIWTHPFMSVIGNYPSISYVKPITNISVNSMHENGILAVLSANIFFKEISDFLRKSYQESGSEIEVFMVDQSSGFLVASSLNASLYTIDANGFRVYYIPFILNIINFYFIFFFHFIFFFLYLNSLLFQRSPLKLLLSLKPLPC